MANKGDQREQKIHQQDLLKLPVISKAHRSRKHGVYVDHSASTLSNRVTNTYTILLMAKNGSYMGLMTMINTTRRGYNAANETTSSCGP